MLNDPTSQPVIERRVVCVLLVDVRGWLLMQHRTPDAPIAPGQWGMPGGGVEPGEQPEAAARRELLEETGLRVAGPLALFWQGLRPLSAAANTLTEWHVYAARTLAVQADVILGEGDAMEFTPPARILALDLSFSGRFFVPRFLASAEYRQLCAEA